MNKAIIVVFFVCLSIVGCSNDHHAFTSRDSWYTGCSQPLSEENEIPRQLINIVPTKNRKQAISTLETVPLLPLSLKTAKKLLDVEALDPDATLEQAAQEAEAEAIKREKLLKDPFFASNSGIKAFAKLNRQKAVKARGLKGKLKPYLIRGLLLNEGTGSFSVYVIDSTICVYHGSLGKHAVPMDRRPLVVFLAHEPKTVFVDVSMAE